MYLARLAAAAVVVVVVAGVGVLLVLPNSYASGLRSSIPAVVVAVAVIVETLDFVEPESRAAATGPDAAIDFAFEPS
jgi:hypothetical protein